MRWLHGTAAGLALIMLMPVVASAHEPARETHEVEWVGCETGVLDPAWTYVLNGERLRDDGGPILFIPGHASVHATVEELTQCPPPPPAPGVREVDFDCIDTGGAAALVEPEPRTVDGRVVVFTSEVNVLTPGATWVVIGNRVIIDIAKGIDTVRVDFRLAWGNGPSETATARYERNHLIEQCAGITGDDLPPPPDFSLAGSDTLGFVDLATATWQLRRHDRVGGGTLSFLFGNPGDIPLIGDWDCDGVDTPGLFRQSDAFAYLRNSNTTGIADIRFFFGDPSDVPLAGDWDGDGCDTLSIYRPGEQRFYVINKLGQNEGGLGAADFSFGFGDPGDKPVVGDWDGDGKDEVGLHRESTGFFYWRNSLDTGVADGQIFFGDPGDQFVAGDWGVVDGVDTPGVYRPPAGLVFLRHTLTQGNADSAYPAVGDLVLVGGQFG